MISYEHVNFKQTCHKLADRRGLQKMRRVWIYTLLFEGLPNTGLDSSSSKTVRELIESTVCSDGEY